MVAVSRRSAQRATAARVREYRQTGHYTPVAVTRAVRERIRATGEAYAQSVLDKQQAKPPKDSSEGHQLARYASLAKYHKANPAFLEAFQEYFYHKTGQKTVSEDEDEE